MATQMDFSTALRKLKQGARLQRAGWNGAGMYVVLASPVTPQEVAEGKENPSGIYGFIRGTTQHHPTLPFLAMKSKDHALVPWVASQTDLLAEDWQAYTSH